MDWTPYDTLLLYEAKHIGVTADPKELTTLIHAQGWQLDSVKWQKDSFLAKASTPNGDKAEMKGPSAPDALAGLLLRVTNLNHIRSRNARTAATNEDWLALGMRMNEVAQAYAKAPMYEIKAALAWHELATDSTRRAEEIANQIAIEIVDNPQPYSDANKLHEDVKKKRHLFVSRANVQHPLWSIEEVLHFRTVHWVMGYVATDAQFGWQGEIMASAAHSKLLSPNAQRALLTDRIGQTAFGFYYGTFMPKIAFLKDIEKSINLEDDKTQRGVHPSQTVVPHALPNFFSHTAALAQGYVQDPNAVMNENGQLEPWSPSSLGVQALHNNAHQWGGDPLDAHKPGGMMDTAGKIDTGWSNLRNADGTDDYETMKKAVSNALKVVLLSPRKDLRWNAIHYQHTMDVNSDDPKRYWDALEAKREEWNQARGFAPGSHKSYYKIQQKFDAYVAQQHPDLDPGQAKEEADREWQYVWQDLEEELANDPKNAKKSPDELDRKVGREIVKRIEKILKPDINPATDVSNEELAKTAAEEITDPSKYGAWMGSQTKACAAAYSHVDELTKAALEDVRQHKGAGFHFRSTLLGLGIPGIGPKVASFAWLLLQPTTSQLATIDTHMHDLLGSDEQKDAKLRDYYRVERELAARRDASGYGSVPLGAFQWGTWDAKRTGLGTHQDHSAMKPLSPMSHDLIDWNAKGGANDAGYDLKTDPRWQWWRDTDAAAQAVRSDWEKNVSPYNPANRTPSKFPNAVVPPQQPQVQPEEVPNGVPPIEAPQQQTFASVASAPWHINDNGTMVRGSAGQSIMNHLCGVYGMTPEEVWQSPIADVGKG